jgi:vacuolar-type H+-ATPase subunit B/Vma2
VKLGKSTNETLQKLPQAFGEHSLSHTVVFYWHSRYKSSRVSVEMGNVLGAQALTKQQRMLRKFKNSSMKTIAKQSMSLQTPLGSVMEFARMILTESFNMRCTTAKFVP